MGRGTLFVISAPSGAGKSSLAREILARLPGLSFSVSFTTRARRPGEENGREYRFVDDGEFDAMVARGGFLEWAHVFGRRYGTGREVTDRALDGGSDLLLDIDVQGARAVRESGVPAVSVFVLPPSFAALEERLRGRGSESEEQVRGRLAQALREAEEFRQYDYLVINDRLERCVEDLRSIVVAERRRVSRCGEEAASVLATFPRP